MTRFILILLVVVGLGLAGGTYYLTTLEFPPNRQAIEKVLPNDRFPR
jgi:hypothetical protein